jgi:uncharacterized membrane protein
MFSALIRLPIIATVLLCVAWLFSHGYPPYPVLKLLHVLAFITLGSGLIGVVVSDLRARRSKSFELLVDSIDAMLLFYYRLVVPGSLLILLSGFSMVFGYYGLSVLQTPWLCGMMVLFVFEFFEGHLIMKAHYIKLRQAVARARAAGNSVPELEDELRSRLTLATHFLDVPNFTLIVILGMLRPSDWTLFTVGVVVVAAITAWLTIYVPRKNPWPGAVSAANRSRAQLQPQ